MSQKLNILLLEDREDDAQLIIYELTRAGYTPQWQRVQDEQAYRQALSADLDIILADYDLPQFTGLAALRILREKELNVPFIVVTGTLEEMALQCMKEGATDYLLKDRLSRLGDAVRRALAERQLRRERTQALANLRESEARFRRLAENALDIIYRFAVRPEPRLQYVNQAIYRLTGYSPDDFYQDPTLVTRVLHPEELTLWQDFLPRKDVQTRIEHRLVHRDGTVRWMQSLTVPIYDQDQQLIALEGVSRDITEKKEAELALKESELKFRTLTERSLVGVFILCDERFCYANEAMADIFGHEVSDLVHNVSPYELIHADERAEVRTESSRLLAGEIEAVHKTFRGVHKSGRLLDCEVMARCIEYEGSPAIMATVQDLTQRMQAEAAERDQRLLAEALQDTATVLNSTLALEAVFDGILNNVDRVVPHDGANIMLLEDGEAYVVACHGRYQQKAITDLVLALRFDVAQTVNLQTMVATKRPFVIPTTLQSDVWASSPATEWVRSHIGAPIQREGQVMGFLNLDSDTPGFYNDDHAARLQAFAEQVAIAIRNAQIYEAEQQQRRIEETLRRSAAVLNESLRLDEVFTRILEQLKSVIEFDSGAVQQKDGDWFVTKVATGFPNPEQVIGMRVPIEPDHPDAEIIQTHKARTIVDATAEYEGFRQMAKQYDLAPIRSWLGVPMVVQDEVIGMITLDRHQIRPFTHGEVALATAFANHAAIALQNAKLYEELSYYSGMLEQMVDERTSTLKQLMKQMETILQNSPDTILLLNAVGRIETANRSLPATFGFKVADIVGHSPGLLLTTDSQTVLEEALAEVRHKQRPVQRQLKACPMFGSQIDVDVALSPVIEKGKVTGMVCSLRDISKLKEVERMKEAFISNVSHELRTPITNLLLHKDLLERNPQKTETYLSRMSREVQRLALIVEDLLRLSRLEQDEVTLEKTAVDLNRLTAQLVNDRRDVAHRESLLLLHEPTAVLPTVQADQGLIEQVLSILLTNAINYTPPDGQIIVSTDTEQAAGQTWVGLRVKDTGPGISADEQQQLFQRFFRGHVGRASGAGGTGLGLAIADEIVKRHNGRIDVASTGVAGEGTTFTVWLPV